MKMSNMQMNQKYGNIHETVKEHNSKSNISKFDTNKQIEN